MFTTSVQEGGKSKRDIPRKDVVGNGCDAVFVSKGKAEFQH